MSFNAFESVQLDGDTIVVTGHTAKSSTPTRIDVAVISVANADKRVQGPAEKPSETPWAASLKQADVAGGEPFAVGECVMVVGAATDTQQRVEIWGGIVPKGHSEVLVVAYVEKA
jgi:hypothetical protein